MKNLERAVRVYRALVESPVKVDSASVVSWHHVEGALKHSTGLLTEMQSLPAKVRDRVLAYVGEFSPLVESRPLFQFPTFSDATQFVREVEESGGSAQRLDNGGLVAASTHDYRTVESIANRLGGARASRPSLGDEFHNVDTTLPEAMMLTHNFDAALVERALIGAIYKRGDRLNENLFVGIKTDGPFAQFESRINNFCAPKPVLGVAAQLAEAVRLSGMATPEMLKIMEAGGAAPGVSPGQSAADNTQPDRGGIAKDQPDNGGSPADSRSNPQQPAEPPTEHVPTQEQGGASNSITLPDGTEVPFDAMKQAFAKMLANLATQVGQGTVGGQPEPRGAGEADAAGTEAPQASAQQQQMAAQTQSQAEVGQPPAPEAPQDAQGAPQAPAAAPEAPAAAAPAEPAAAAPAAPEGQPPAAPAEAPAAGGDVESVLAAAEAGDAEALKNAQGMQGQMDDAQKARLQALLQAGAAPPAAPAAPAVESRRRRAPRGRMLAESRVAEARFPTIGSYVVQGSDGRAHGSYPASDRRSKSLAVSTVTRIANRDGEAVLITKDDRYPANVISRETYIAVDEPGPGIHQTHNGNFQVIRESRKRRRISEVSRNKLNMVTFNLAREWQRTGLPNSDEARQIIADRLGMDPDSDAVTRVMVNILGMQESRRSVNEARTEFKVGDIVRYTGKFLRNTGMAVGPWGQQKATVVGVDRASLKGLSPERYMLLQWDDEDEPKLINKANVQLHPRYRNRSESVNEASGPVAAIQDLAHTMHNAVSHGAPLDNPNLKAELEKLDYVIKHTTARTGGMSIARRTMSSVMAAVRKGDRRAAQAGLDSVVNALGESVVDEMSRLNYDPSNYGSDDPELDAMIKGQMKRKYAQRAKHTIEVPIPGWGVIGVMNMGDRREAWYYMRTGGATMSYLSRNHGAEKMFYQLKNAAQVPQRTADRAFRELQALYSQRSESLAEKKGPPKKWVKGLEDEPGVRNPEALANWMKDKGYQSRKESVREAYVVVQENARCSVWAPTKVHRMAVLPEGLDYGKRQVERGAQAVIVEAGEQTALLQFDNGDQVRVPLSAMREDTSNGSTLDEVFARLREQGVVEAVVVAGPPTSGRGYFVKYGIGPWALRQGRGLSEAVFPSLTGLSAQITDHAANDLRLALAQEDFSKLREARSETEFGEMLFGRRFQHVSEGRGKMLRDHIDWDSFAACPTFKSYMRHEGVQRYYSAVAAPSNAVDANALKMLRERKQEAIIQLGEAAVIDAAPTTSLVSMIEAAHRAGMRTTLVDLHVGMDTVLDRCAAVGISESKAIRAANAVREQVDALRRDSRLGRYVRYDWRATGDGMFEGKFDNRQAVTRTTTDIDGDNPDAPKKRKDIVVRESMDDIEGFRSIVKRHQHGPVGDVPDVDATTANFVVQVYDKLNATNKKKFASMDASRMIDITFKMMGESRAGRSPNALMETYSGGATHTRSSMWGVLSEAETLARTLDHADPRSMSEAQQRAEKLVETLTTIRGSLSESVRRNLRAVHEQLESGDGAEAESCASGMKEAGEQLAAAREAIFKLTTSTLVQCASMAQATGAKGTQKALDKAQQIGASFLDELKALSAALDKANEVMKGENGGMGGDNVEQMKAAAEAPAVDPATAVAPAADPLAAAPVPTTPAPAATPAAAPVPESIEDRAVAVLLETDIPQRIAGGAHHRELSEAVRSFCPTLDVRQRARVIDRISSVVNVPTNANVRVSFSVRDHRLLTDVARFGSVTESLVDRTRGRRATLATVDELHSAIKALESGSTAHALLARTLSESISGFDRRLLQPSQLIEAYSFGERKSSGAQAWAGPYADQKAKGSFKLNVKTTDVKRALKWAEETYARFGLDVYEDLPNLERNYQALKKKMKFGTVQRINMPVIEPEELDQFKTDIEAGKVDIFAPWAPEHLENLFPWEHSGKPKMPVGDKTWITLGVRDGEQSDDILPKGIIESAKSVKELKPLQNEIWFDKLIATMLAFGPAVRGSFPNTKGIAMVSEDNFIIDGHHRFGQIMLTDPSVTMNVLKVPMKREKLLAVARSYGTAIGNRSKA